MTRYLTDGFVYPKNRLWWTFSSTCNEFPVLILVRSIREFETFSRFQDFWHTVFQDPFWQFVSRYLTDYFIYPKNRLRWTFSSICNEIPVLVLVRPIRELLRVFRIFDPLSSKTDFGSLCLAILLSISYVQGTSLDELSTQFAIHFLSWFSWDQFENLKLFPRFQDFCPIVI